MLITGCPLVGREIRLNPHYVCKPGQYIHVKGVQVEKPLKGFFVCASYHGQNDPHIEIFEGRLFGERIGTCYLHFIPDRGAAKFTCSLERPYDGKQELFLLLNGDEINIHSFGFTVEVPEPMPYERLIKNYEPVLEDRLVDIWSDTWVLTDGLNRTIPDSSEVGLPRKNKYVGIFYWTWHTLDGTYPPKNNSEILKNHPEAIHDVSHPAWGPLNTRHYWQEPLFGYYTNMDKWVMRKHAQMLADAGVDVVIFDNTNGYLTWEPQYMTLCQAFYEARLDGIKTPQISFMLPFWDLEFTRLQLESLYRHLYRPGIYRDLWFYWKGKPLIMAMPECLVGDPENPYRDKLHKEIREFFTFRPGQPGYECGPSRSDHWGWLEVYPQHGYCRNNDGTFEQVTVGIAQNHSAEKKLTAMNGENVFGRSYTVRNGRDPKPDAKLYGANVEEQWSRAFELDPELIFVTGWNEFTAGRYDIWPPNENGVVNAFPDQFDEEHSRDIEPVKGALKDHYYCQFIGMVRRFKGARPLPVPSEPKTIDIYKGFEEWTDVAPTYYNHKAGTEHRDFPGAMKGTYYRNYTLRNNILRCKVARDQTNLYFYVQTAETLTKPFNKNWMRLFLDIDLCRQTGWEGYDFMVEEYNGEGYALLKKHVEGFIWQAVGRVAYATSGNRLALCIPRALLGLEGKTLDFAFKWSDNMQRDGDILDFYENGNVAPSGRFNYRYKE